MEVQTTNQMGENEMRKKIIGTMVLTGLCMCAAFPAFAGEWSHRGDTTKYWTDGWNLAKDEWVEIDGRNYYFAWNGFLVTNEITPDGYYVDEEGAWDGQPAVQWEHPAPAEGDVIWEGMTDAQYQHVVHEELMKAWKNYPMPHTEAPNENSAGWIQYASIEYATQNDESIDYFGNVTLSSAWSDMAMNYINFEGTDHEEIVNYYRSLPQLNKITLDVLLGKAEADRIWPSYAAAADGTTIHEGYAYDCSIDPTLRDENYNYLNRPYMVRDFGDGARRDRDYEGYTASGHRYTITETIDARNSLRIYEKK